MGIIKDMLDAVKDISTTTKDASGVFKEKTKSSISKEASEGILQFPVLVSRSLDMETSNMVAKALEKNYASFVQVVLSMNPTFSFEGGKNATDFIRQFHQNVDTRSNVFDVKNAVMSIGHENLSIAIDEGSGSDVCILSIITHGGSGRIYQENINKLRSLLDDINMETVNGLPTSIKKEYFINSRLVSDEFNAKYGNVSEAHNSDAARLGVTGNEAIKYQEARAQEIANDTMSGMSKEKREDHMLNRGKHEPILKIERHEGGFTDTKGTSHEITLPRDVLKWAQTQKLNELMPTHLIVKIKAMGEDGIPKSDIEFIIGVKSTLHPIDSKEMVQNMVAACKNNNTIFNFVKWTTGETSFFKDFLFNINEIKDDVMHRSSGASSWWISLKRRKAMATVKKFMFLPNNILPNATIVLSMEEVNYIKAEYGYDLLSPYFMDSIMKAYFLLGFVVVDNSTQVVHMMFDGQNNFQSYTFTGLQKEADSKEDFKQMLKLINRI